MMSGRGLGHTGGTLDKLESIPGMNVFPDADTAKRLIRDHGGVFLGQTRELAPLDKKLYALRDVTGTVESIPLITASILSKKLASGVQNLVMDIKYGSGAFMASLAQAKELATSITRVGRAAGLRLSSYVTQMEQPLGRFAGNANEVWECISIMRGESEAPDTKLLALELSCEMLRLAGLQVTMNDLESKIRSGEVYAKFCAIIAAQGGDAAYLEALRGPPPAAHRACVTAREAGYVAAIDVRQLGLAVLQLGGGRQRAEDPIDPLVGLSDFVKIGQRVEKGDTLVEIHGAQEGMTGTVQKMLEHHAFVIADQPVNPPELIAERMRDERA
jgi:pyrimidine-nucleoside phosphorylase